MPSATAKPFDWNTLSGAGAATLQSTFEPIIVTCENLESTVTRLSSQVARLELELRLREEELKMEKLHRYGAKGDKINADQTALLDLELSVSEEEVASEAARSEEEKQLAEAVAAARKEEAAVKKNRKGKGGKQEAVVHPGRNPLPAHLERQEVIIPCTEAPNGTLIGYDEKEELHIKPAQAYVRVIKREKMLVSINGRSTVITAETQPRIVPKGQLSDEVALDLVLKKYADHLPIFRQMEQWKRDFGIAYSDSTANRYVLAVGELFEPLAQSILCKGLQGPVLQVDETRLMVLQSEGKGRNDTNWLWQYSTPKLVYFDFQKSRGRDGPAKILRNFRGIMQTDGYTVYQNVAGQAHAHAACWAHARRKFVTAHEASPKTHPCKKSADIVEKINELYKVERDAKENNLTGQSRLEYRRAQEVNEKLAKLKEIITESCRGVLPKSNLGKACEYTLKLWDKLMIYADNGEVEIDNNWCENAMRPVALGRKNWMHIGSEESGPKVAAIMSVIESAKRNKLHLPSYLEAVAKALVNQEDRKNPPEAVLESLLPDVWKADA